MFDPAEIFLDGAVLVAVLSGVPLLASMLVGIVLGILQAATQIQEHSLSFVPKLIAVGAVFVVVGPWMGQRLLSYCTLILERCSQYGAALS